jgi:hypothetical protein
VRVDGVRAGARLQVRLPRPAQLVEVRAVDAAGNRGTPARAAR